jgi:translation initiation factor 1 (eIF-1/SUI1)
MEPTELAKNIADKCSTELQVKFMKGQKEHGGDFAVRATVRDVRDETLDLINYTHMLEEHQTKIIEKLNKIIACVKSNTVSNTTIELQLVSLLENIKNL